MPNQLDLSQLSVKQLVDLLWELKGTPPAAPVYKELSNRQPRLTLKPDDPNWEEKLRDSILARQAMQP